MPGKKRIAILLVAVFLFFLALNIRLIYIQIVQHTRYYKEAAVQRSMSVKISDNRGAIYDRNMIPLVGDNKVKYAVVFPEFVSNVKEAAKLLEEASGEKGILLLFNSRKPFAKKLSSVKQNLLDKLEKNNIFIVDSFERYGGSNLARHLIGYTAAGDGHGRSGIEKAYDQYLFSMQGKYVGIVSDALHNSIEGLGVRFIDEKEFKGELDVKLCLDYHIQKIVEESMDRNGITGAVVAIRVDDGDVAAMASRPQFKQDNIESYINKDGSELVNRALSPYNAGSIFKIVVAAAGLENGLLSTNDTFYCCGEKVVQGRPFRCSASHGFLNLQDAFAVSCNSTFIEAGLRVGKDNILEMARKFGLGQTTGIDKLGVNESTGKLPDSKFASDKETANIAIGQGDILITPVQAASMAAVVANGGIKNKVNLVDSIVDSRGNVIDKIRTVEKKRIISEYTAARLKKMMEQVTERGTGIKANIPEYGGAAGKTGTAQTGWMKDGTPRVHAWFAGYFPREKPQYALVVFVENGRSGSDKAAPLFGQIAAEIMKLGER